MSNPRQGQMDYSTLIGQKLKIVAIRSLKQQFELRQGRTVIASLYNHDPLLGRHMTLVSEAGGHWEIIAEKGILRLDRTVIDQNTGQRIAEFTMFGTKVEFLGTGTFTSHRPDLWKKRSNLTDQLGNPVIKFKGSAPAALKLGPILFSWVAPMIVWITISSLSYPNGLLCLPLFLGLLVFVTLIALGPHMYCQFLMTPMQVRVKPSAASLPNLPLAILLTGLWFYDLGEMKVGSLSVQG